ncbi:MAG: ribose 5-phosphate isomerase B [Myxococcota bacterium]|nr:ribose 5-phosphate isomerase B [Myxococcota bacterium]
MKVAIASDHGGFTLRHVLMEHLNSIAVEVLDLGCRSEESVHYPDYASECAHTILKHDADIGILVCGTGLGMSIAANKVDGIRATVCTSEYMARMARAHNNSNILCLGERVVGSGIAVDIVNAFIETQFEGGRHQLRIDKISQLEQP